ncbi:MAG: ADP-ribosylation factor-like protein [Candidatus Heimdallarchaeota archaeon]
MAETAAMIPKGGKIILFGLAEAGKTSIHHRCFLQTELPDIEKLQPTLLMSVDSPQIPFLSDEISLWDLGGQEGYIQSHIRDPQIFRSLRVIIYVVDITKTEALSKIKAHFSAVEKILIENKENPIRFAFLHKFDPDKRKNLARNLSIFLAELQTTLPPETTYVSTSIYDETAHNAITNVLYSAFPVEVLRQAFSNTFLPELYQKFSIEHLRKMAKSTGIEVINQRLFDVFNSLGRAIGKNLKISWSKIMAGAMDFESQGKTDYLEFEALSGRQIAISVDCPFVIQEIDENFPVDVCLMTRGLLTGVIETLRLGGLTEIETVHHNRDTDCKQCRFLVLAAKGLEAQTSGETEED